MNIKQRINIAILLLAILNLEAMAYEYKNTSASINSARQDFEQALTEQKFDVAESIVKALEKVAPNHQTTKQLRTELNQKRQADKEIPGQKAARILDLEQQLTQKNQSINELTAANEKIATEKHDLEIRIQRSNESINTVKNLLLEQKQIVEAREKEYQDEIQKLQNQLKKQVPTDNTAKIAKLEKDLLDCQATKINNEAIITNMKNEMIEQQEKMAQQKKAGQPDAEKIAKLEQELANCTQTKTNQEAIITNMKNEMIEQQEKTARQKADFNQKISNLEQKINEQETNLTRQIEDLKTKALNFEMLLTDNGIIH